MTSPILIFMIAGFFIYAGTRWLKMARQTMKIAQASLQWPKTPGRITASVVLVVDEGGEPPTAHFLADVTYTYTVGELLYTGKTIAYRDPRLGQKEAQLIVTKYPVGSDATVSYDPNDPRNGVLEPGTAGVQSYFSWAKYSFLLGFAVAIIGVVALILHLFY